MTIDNDKQQRAKFLSRVVSKEIKHLKYSASKLFKDEFSIEKAKTLSRDEELAEQLEAFTSRFCRLQDTIGDKLLPVWLDILNEKTKVSIDNFDKAEKIGVLSSVDRWLELRQLRNQMVHEYIEDLILLVDAIQTCYKHLGFIVMTGESIINDLEKRQIL